MRDTVNRDELNCPVCPAETLMEAHRCTTDEIEDGTVIACPSCGFHVGAQSAVVAEAAVRQLQYGAWMEMADG